MFTPTTLPGDEQSGSSSQQLFFQGPSLPYGSAQHANAVSQPYNPPPLDAPRYPVQDPARINYASPTDWEVLASQSLAYTARPHLGSLPPPTERFIAFPEVNAAQSAPTTSARLPAGMNNALGGRDFSDSFQQLPGPLVGGTTPAYFPTTSDVVHTATADEGTSTLPGIFHDSWIERQPAAGVPYFSSEGIFGESEGAVAAMGISTLPPFSPVPTSSPGIGSSSRESLPHSPGPTRRKTPPRSRPRRATVVGNASSRSASEGKQIREQISAEKWESHKPTIKQLYLEERNSLKEVMRIMKERYGFQATPKMYKTRFSQWGFVKNNTEDEVKKLLSMKFERDANGKVSEFVRNGRVVNIHTYLKRKGVTEYDLFDFATPTELPTYVRCRTPSPPPLVAGVPSSELMRAKELLVENLRRAFLQCRQNETEMGSELGWSSMMMWGTRSSDMLYEASKLFERGYNDQAEHLLVRAFEWLEVDLSRVTTQGIRDLLMAMASRNPGMVTALGKYLAAYAANNLNEAQPLRQVFACLHDVEQTHGPAALADLIWSCIPSIAEEIETIHGPRSPQVARMWIDLATLYDYKDLGRLERLSAELAPLTGTVEARHGARSAEFLAFMYTRAQLLFLWCPGSQVERDVATELWNMFVAARLVFPVRDQPGVYCYHSVGRPEPWMKRLTERYVEGMRNWERISGIQLITHFAEEPHLVEHAEGDEAVVAMSGGGGLVQ